MRIEEVIPNFENGQRRAILCELVSITLLLFQ